MDVTKHTRGLLVAAMAAFVVLAAGVVIAACGDDDDGGTVSGPAAAQKTGNAIDLGFVRDMIPHHESAIEMADVASERGQSEFVKDLAGDILRTQNAEIRQLRGIGTRLDEAGVRRAGDLGLESHEMGMEGDTAQLREAEPFDRAFIDMMVPHHQGAIRMARVELAKGENAEAKRLARAIIAAQTREIEAMNEHRQEEFGGPSPAGGVPEEDGAPGAAEETDEEHGGGHGG